MVQLQTLLQIIPKGRKIIVKNIDTVLYVGKIKKALKTISGNYKVIGLHEYISNGYIEIKVWKIYRRDCEKREE